VGWAHLLQAGSAGAHQREWWLLCAGVAAVKAGVRPCLQALPSCRFRKADASD